MRLTIVSCVAAVAALVLTALPASAGCGKYRYGCGGGYTVGYTYAYPAYTYGYAYPAYGYGYGNVGCGRVYARNCYGYRVYTVPSYTYSYARPCRRRCW